MDFWTFSVLKMIVLSLAFCWAQKYFNFGLNCAWVADFAIFQGEGGVTFHRFYFGMFPTKCCPWTPTPPNILVILNSYIFSLSTKNLFTNFFIISSLQIYQQHHHFFFINRNF